MSFKFKRLEIPDVVLVEPKKIGDARGFFVEVYKSSDFNSFGIDKQIVQINYSKSQKSVLRGLHYQKEPCAQAKLVRVVQGEIFDVVVDIRKGSPSYGKWVGVNLDSDSMNMLYVPEGFAHGFLTLSDEAEIEYYCSSVYSPENERGIIYNDSTLNISWPEENLLLSKKDLENPQLDKSDNDFIYEK